MRYPASEKLEIIQLVEQSPLPVRHTLAKLGEPPANWWTPLLSSEEEREGVEWARDVVNLPMSSSGRP